MRSLVRFTQPLFWLLFFLGTANAVPRGRVVVLRGSEIEWQTGSHILLAELEATGFLVLTQNTSAQTPGQLIDELRSAGEKEKCGAVVVFKGRPHRARTFGCPNETTSYK